jgi:hypothetical protein
MIPRVVPDDPLDAGAQNQLIDETNRNSRVVGVGDVEISAGMAGQSIRVRRGGSGGTSMKLFELTSGWIAETGASSAKCWHYAKGRAVGFGDVDSSGTLCCVASADQEASSGDLTWSMDGDADEETIWHPNGYVGSIRDDQLMKDKYAPRSRVGDWIWCVRDSKSGYWVAIQHYEELVRFELIEDLASCGSAYARMLIHRTKESEGGQPGEEGANTCTGVCRFQYTSGEWVLQYSDCDPDAECGCDYDLAAIEAACEGAIVEGAWSILPCKTATGEGGDSDQAGLSQEDFCETEPSCADECADLCFLVHDTMGVVASSVLSDVDGTIRAGSTGYAKHYADSGKWEIVSIGYCACESSSEDVTSYVEVVTDIYCASDGSGIIVCTRLLAFDRLGHLIAIGDEECG